MVEFLSAEWVSALDQAARDSTAFADCSPGRTLVIEQRVTMPDGSERAHQLVIDDRRARVEQGRGTAPDVVLETDLDAARELALGTVNAQHALAAGRLRVSGTIEALVEHGDALRALDDIFRGVRAQTTFAPGGTSTVASAP